MLLETNKIYISILEYNIAPLIIFGRTKLITKRRCFSPVRCNAWRFVFQSGAMQRLTVRASVQYDAVFDGLCFSPLRCSVWGFVLHFGSVPDDVGRRTRQMCGAGRTFGHH